MKTKNFGKEQTNPPTCPFCGLYIDKPVELQSHRMGDMPVGSCSCGAVYAYDAIGKNLGSAFIEALVFACNMDWDLAWSLFPNEDYLEQLVEHYDGISHQFVPGGFYEGRKIPGALYFIRLHKDIQEVTKEGVNQTLTKAVPLSPAMHFYQTVSSSQPLKMTKEAIKHAVEHYQLDAIVAAAQDKRILRLLQKLLYAVDLQTRCRAAEALGKASSVVSKKDPGAVANLLQSLLYAVSDTAASSWGAFDAIGEIIAACPELYGGYLTNLYQFLEEEPTRPAALSALGKISLHRPDLVRKALYRSIGYLSDPSPQTRGYTAWLMGNLSAREALPALEALFHDHETLLMYQAGELKEKTVADLAKEAQNKIENKRL